MSRRFAPVLLAAVALLAAACPPSEPDDAPAPQGQPTAPTGATGPAGPTGDGMDGGGGDEGGGEQPQVDPENQSPPEVEPVTPPAGGTLSPAFKVEASGTDPDQGFSRPMLILVRNESAEGKAAARSPSPQAADAIRSWSDYGERAIVAVFAGAQPDAGHTVQVEAMTVAKKGRDLTVFIRVEVGGDAAAAVVSVPWAVVSVPAGQLANVRNCFVAINQQAVPSEC